MYVIYSCFLFKNAQKVKSIASSFEEKAHETIANNTITSVLTLIKSPFRSPVYKVSPPKRRAKKKNSAKALFEHQPSCDNKYV